MSWSQWTEPRRLIGAGVLLLLLASPAAAEDAAACGKFKWPLATEKSWFDAASDLKAYASGAASDELADGALTIATKPMAEITFILPPEGKPKPDKT